MDAGRHDPATMPQPARETTTGGTRGPAHAREGTGASQPTLSVSACSSARACVCVCLLHRTCKVKRSPAYSVPSAPSTLTFHLCARASAPPHSVNAHTCPRKSARVQQHARAFNNTTLLAGRFCAVCYVVRAMSAFRSPRLALSPAACALARSRSPSACACACACMLTG